jgi:hypothetical protein
LLFVLGILVIAGLAFWIVRLHAKQDPPPRHPTATVSSPPTTTTAAVLPTTTSSGVTWIRLELTGRTATAVTVRRGSSTGRVLYQGTLGAGETRSFAGARLWMHVDTAGDVSATLDGKKLVLPADAGSVEITSGGIEPQ